MSYGGGYGGGGYGGSRGGGSGGGGGGGGYSNGYESSRYGSNSYNSSHYSSGYDRPPGLDIGSVAVLSVPCILLLHLSSPCTRPLHAADRRRVLRRAQPSVLREAVRSHVLCIPELSLTFHS